MARPAWMYFVAAVFALIAQTSRMLELVLVQHTVCEHGELIHPHGAPGAERESPAREDPHASAAPDAPEGSSGSHDHCFASTLHHTLDGIGPSLTEPSMIEADEVRGILERRAAYPIELLYLAPKASPPHG